MIYAMTRTFYVEPTTGAPLNRVEERNQVLSYDGTEVPAFVGTVQYTEESQADSLDKVETRATLLRLADVGLPDRGDRARPAVHRRWALPASPPGRRGPPRRSTRTTWSTPDGWVSRARSRSR